MCPPARWIWAGDACSMCPRASRAWRCSVSSGFAQRRAAQRTIWRLRATTTLSFWWASPGSARTSATSAARFVTLIDALYESKVKLIATADAEPADLYPSGDGRFEFERTVSRLIEMQSRDYLALGHGEA